MSYWKDLEEYTDEELERELARRQRLREQGLCSYCRKPLASAANPTRACKQHEEVEGAVHSGKITVRRL